jgi:hypothetical protein
MNKIKMADVWNTPGLIPLSNFTRRATVDDTGVDYSHLNFSGQVDRTVSATFNSGNNTPTAGEAGAALQTFA